MLLTLLLLGLALENDPKGPGIPASLRLEDRPRSMPGPDPFCCSGEGCGPLGRGVMWGLPEGDLWCTGGGVALLHTWSRLAMMHRHKHIYYAIMDRGQQCFGKDGHACAQRPSKKRFFVPRGIESTER